jgi:hypothetical protein
MTTYQVLGLGFQVLGVFVSMEELVRLDGMVVVEGAAEHPHARRLQVPVVSVATWR